MPNTLQHIKFVGVDIGLVTKRGFHVLFIMNRKSESQRNIGESVIRHQTHDLFKVTETGGGIIFKVEVITLFF